MQDFIKKLRPEVSSLHASAVVARVRHRLPKLFNRHVFSCEVFVGPPRTIYFVVVKVPVNV